MKKWKKTAASIVIVVFVLSCIYRIAQLACAAYIIIDSAEVQYSFEDMATYFDDEGRYQLKHFDGYYIEDAAENQIIFPDTQYYKVIDNKVYIIYTKYIKDKNEREKRYGILDISNGEVTSSTSINGFDEQEKEIFQNRKEMINLTVGRSDWEKYWNKYNPYKDREF